MRNLFSALLITAMLLTMLAGCAPMVAPTGQPAAAPTGDEAAAATAGAESGTVSGAATTLTVWDDWTRAEDSALMDKLVADFQTAHPGVTVNRVVKSFALF